MDERLRPIERIRRKKDFLELYKKGHRIKGRYFNLIFRPTSFQYSRLGVVVSKKIGKAVVRNRIKRWFRELFRRNKGLLPRPYDLVFIAREEITSLGWPEIKEEFEATLGRLSGKNSG
ncbi:MAG: ribonuclease P protein component [Candidatus Saccharicenans sp.]|nr:MAG: ribonuclease P protein component [Candidatus Aminicenantes bacterium]HEK86431.1 ribonuclease P protein component [Candidatus Aminicenantes bacterium]